MPGHRTPPGISKLEPPQERAEARDHADSASTEQRLHAMVRHWTGTPHRMGGTDRRGIDCSGFVQRIYRDLFGIGLPRATAGQVHVGTSVQKSDLRIADLVFFKPPHKVRHVGIYLGNGQFAHASGSRGVIVSRLDATYWQNAYWTAKRVLNAH